MAEPSVAKSAPNSAAKRRRPSNEELPDAKVEKWEEQADNKKFLNNFAYKMTLAPPAEAICAHKSKAIFAHTSEFRTRINIIDIGDWQAGCITVPFAFGKPVGQQGWSLLLL